MNRWLLGSFLGLALLTLTGDAADGQPAKKQGNWFTNYEQARAAARQAGKPLFVVFRCQP